MNSIFIKKIFFHEHIQDSQFVSHTPTFTFFNIIQSDLFYIILIKTLPGLKSKNTKTSFIEMQKQKLNYRFMIMTLSSNIMVFLEVCTYIFSRWLNKSVYSKSLFISNSFKYWLRCFLLILSDLCLDENALLFQSSNGFTTKFITQTFDWRRHKEGYCQFAHEFSLHVM